MGWILDYVQEHIEAIVSGGTVIAFLVGVIRYAYQLGGRDARNKIDAIIKTEVENAVHKSEDAYRAERTRAERLEAGIHKIKELAYFRHWPYHPHDDPPRRVLCPKCQTVLQVKDDTYCYVPLF